jgi:hypothetical protein
MEEAAQPGKSVGMHSGPIDRRICVAPMMDWTDSLKTVLGSNNLEERKRACLLYVPSCP